MLTSPDVPFDHDELVLVLNLHRVSKGEPTQDHLSTLSRELRARLTRMRGAEPEPKVRSTSGIKMKVDAFEDARLKKPPGRGWSKDLQDVWDDLGGDTKRIWDAAKKIRDAEPEA